MTTLGSQLSIQIAPEEPRQQIVLVPRAIGIQVQPHTDLDGVARRPIRLAALEEEQSRALGDGECRHKATAMLADLDGDHLGSALQQRRGIGGRHQQGLGIRGTAAKRASS
jgi:hypothetical protein